QIDAWCFADALRVDGQHWRGLAPTDPLVGELRLLCRAEIELMTQPTSLCPQLQQALHEYYPAALEAFDDWTQPYTWEWVNAFATPQVLVKAGRRKWEKYLHGHKLWPPQTVQQRPQIVARADQFCGGLAPTRAKSRLAV